ncbi:MAG: hypothetical protein L3J22_05815 [Xanthomonadales bacterium]|nr:hypothetical protein [Xanthomonadales bacterium]
MPSKTLQCASAPGKMVLIGEYAVTQGLPALSMAVDRRASVCRSSAPNQQHTIHSSMLDGKVFSFDKSATNFDWNRPPPTAIKAFVEQLPWPQTRSELKGISFDLDSRQFFFQARADGGENQKLGIGSSAALMLAACRVLEESGGSAESASKSHYQLQSQTGSGIDLATSIHGGLICFQQLQKVKLLNLPANFYWQAVWTGESAKTQDFLQAFNHWLGTNPTQWKLQQNSAASLIAEAIRAVGRNDGIALSACIRAYGEWMRDLGNWIQQPIYTPAFEEIREISLATDCAWKPSGAGGGDIGIVCATSRHNLTEISRTISDAGYKILDLEVDLNGLKVFKQ